MAVRVAITRRVPERLVEGVRPYLLRLRALAMEQPGYISGETLVNVDDPEEVLVLSSWRSLEDWRAWQNDPQRREISNELNLLLGSQPTHRVYQHG